MRFLPKSFSSLSQVLWETRKATAALGKLESPTDELSHKAYEAALHKIGVDWSENLFKILGLEMNVSGAQVSKEPTLFVANHVGYVDIPLMVHATSGAFVAKKEVKSFPFFGAGAEKYGTVFVDRASPEARRKVASLIGEFIKTRKKNVILFPEGTSSPWGVEWKRGAFAIAKQANIPVQPLRIAYSPQEKVAYWGDHFLPVHLLGLLKHGSFKADVEIFEPQMISDVEKDTALIQEKIQNSLKEKLSSWGEWRAP